MILKYFNLVCGILGSLFMFDLAYMFFDVIAENTFKPRYEFYNKFLKWR